MAQDPEDLDVPQDNWELVSSILDDPKANPLPLSPPHKEHEQYIDEHSFANSELIDMNYFASGGSSNSKTNNNDKTAEDKTNSSTGINPDFDWIEPSTPIRSCVLVSSEDDDSSAKSSSEDSREGVENSAKEKHGSLSASFDTETFGEDFSAALLHDMLLPVEALEESCVETSGVVNEVSRNETNEPPPWKLQLKAWLTDAKRTSTLCTLALAATVIGLVLIGNGWQRLQLQFQKIRCQFLSKGKGMGQVIYQLVQIKELSSSKRRLVSKTQTPFPDFMNHV